MTAVSIIFYDAPLENNANPLSTPLHTVAPWYFLWIQGLLKLGDKTLMGVIVPTILMVSFMAMPYFDVGPFRDYFRRRFAISLSMLFIVFIVLTSWMGTPAFLVQTSLDQEIFFELAPGEKVGEVRAVPYDELVQGRYCVDDESCTILNERLECVGGKAEGCFIPFTAPDGIARSTEFYDVMEHYLHMVEEAREVAVANGGLPNAVAGLTVETVQANLKGVDLIIVWDNQNNPSEPLESILYVPIHRDAYALGGE